MKPLSWQELRKVCRLAHCVDDRQRGDHFIMTRPGLARPVVIKKEKALSNNIVLSIRRTLGLSADEFQRLVEQVRGSRKQKRKAKS